MGEFLTPREREKESERATLERERKSERATERARDIYIYRERERKRERDKEGEEHGPKAPPERGGRAQSCGPDLVGRVAGAGICDTRL